MSFDFNDDQNLIAFSGGVDSSVVAYAVNQVFPLNSLCILGRSASLPNDQLEIARKVAQQFYVYYILFTT